MYVVRVLDMKAERCFPCESIIVLGCRRDGKKVIYEEFRGGPDVERLASKALRDCENEDKKK